MEEIYKERADIFQERMVKALDNFQNLKPLHGRVESTFSSGGMIKNAYLEKQADDSSADVTTSDPSWYHPALTPPNWLLPRSLIESHNWCNTFYNNDPYVNAIISLHSEYPLSKFDLVCSDNYVKQFFEKMLSTKKWDLYTFICEAALQYWKLGEFIACGVFNSKEKIWDSWTILDSDSVIVRKPPVLGADLQFRLKITDTMKVMAKSDSESDRALFDNMPEYVKAAILSEQPIDLPANEVGMMARITRPGDVRGTSIMTPLMKELMYFDKLRVAQQAIADRHVTPLQLWKIGNVASGIVPTGEQLDEFRAELEQAALDPSFNLIWHDAVQYEAVGIIGKILPLIPEFNWIETRIMVGLGVNQNILMGEGPSFSNQATMSLQVLINRYVNFRDKLEKWVENNIFRRISEENNFYDKSDPPKLIIPQISWYKDLVIQSPQEKDVYYKLWKDGVLSTQTLFSKFKELDYEIEKERLMEEQGSIFDKERLAKPTKKVVTNSTGGVAEMTHAPQSTSGKPVEGTPPKGGETPSTQASPATPAQTTAPAAVPAEVPVG